MDVLGDLEEEYAWRVQEVGSFHAAGWYWAEVLHAIPAFLVRSIGWSVIMLRSYLYVALRTLAKQKLYTMLNILGLAIGLACFILIARYVQYELSYDTFHEKADRIHRVIGRWPGSVYMGTDLFAVDPAPLAPALTSEFPEVTYATAVRRHNTLLGYGDGHYYEEGIRADAHLFSVFTFPLFRGNPETALADPHTIVLTESLARKVFGDEEAMGKTLLLENEEVYTVTGIAYDVPENAHFPFSFVTSMVSDPDYVEALQENNWVNNSWHTYVLLQDGVLYKDFQAKMEAFAAKYLSVDEAEKRNQYILQPLTSIHLHSHINFELAANNDIKYIYVLSGIALVILLLACVNYTNLAVARSIKRVREVGMRKVVGASRGQLIVQFIGESVLLAVMALALAVGMVFLVLPVFGQFVGRDLSITFVDFRLSIFVLMGLAVVVGIISGSYPALLMSSLRPSLVLKGKLSSHLGRWRLRSLLIVGQYAISMILVVGSVVIYQQLGFIQNKELGYSREHTVAVTVEDNAFQVNYDAIKSELLNNANVLGVTSAGHLPSHITSRVVVRGWEGSTTEDALPIHINAVDYDFLDVFEVELVAGRNFSPDFATDVSGAYLLNETAVQALGWEQAIGKAFNFQGQVGPVVGVMKDFHLHSLHQPIQPLVFYLDPSEMRYLLVKVVPENIPATVAHIEHTLQAFSPFPFAYEFLDQAFDRQYKTERTLGQLSGIFTGLALLIASLGLFGLAAYTAEQRTQEVGVRKVLGATVPGLVVLLSREFTKLVIVAFVVAVPVAYFVMHQWLENFAYRIEIGPLVFVMTLVSVLLIAWLSVSYQAFRAARANPVHALRYE